MAVQAGIRALFRPRNRESGMRIPSLCGTLRATSSCVRRVATKANGETDRVTRKGFVLAVWMALALLSGLGVSTAQAERIILFQAHGYDPLDEPPAMQYQDEKSSNSLMQQPPQPQAPSLQAPGQAQQPNVPSLPMPLAGIPNIVAFDI